MTASPPAVGGTAPRRGQCGLAARLLSVRALVPRHHGLSLRRFAPGGARLLPPDMLLQAALATILAGQLLLRRQSDGSLVIGKLWTRFGWCRAEVGGRLVDEALMLAREAACTRFSSRLAREDLEFQAALRARDFSSREADEGELIFELAVEPS